MADASTLNVVQQVLKGITISLAMHRQEDLAKLASALQAFASTHNLEPEAVAMLQDLAQGFDMLGRASSRPS